MRTRSNNRSLRLSEDYNNPYFGSYETFKKLIHNMDGFFSFIKTKGIIEKHPLFTKDFRGNCEFYLERINEGKAKIHEMAYRPAFVVECDIALLVHEWLNLPDRENIPITFFDKLPPYYKREAKGIMTRLGWKGGFEPVLMY